MWLGNWILPRIRLSGYRPIRVAQIYRYDNSHNRTGYVTLLVAVQSDAATRQVNHAICWCKCCGVLLNLVKSK